MNIFAFVALLIAVADSATIYEAVTTEEWKLFKAKYKKSYPPEEDQERMMIFLDNRQKIARHNRKFENGSVTYAMAMNHFGDMTLYEFSKRMNGFNRSSRIGWPSRIFWPSASDDYEGASFLEPANVEVPDAIDWRKQGAVTPVKNQGACGSCWAFSATGALEGQHFRHKGKLVSLSEQNLIDCSRKYGNGGCEGGLMDSAFRYVRDNKGIDTEKSYPYEAEDDQCRYNPENSGADDAGFVDLPSGNEDKLKAAVATVGPISVAIDADHYSFMFYSHGILYEPDCSSSQLDHGVLAVGYGTDQKTGKPYWLVKNSWSEKWGDKGYVRMSRNRHNNCGIATMASYPLVK